MPDFRSESCIQDFAGKKMKTKARLASKILASKKERRVNGGSLEISEDHVSRTNSQVKKLML